jgi:GxxExxY protein
MSTRYEPSSVDLQLTGKIIGAAIEVHRLLGPGFLESIYENAMEIELRLRDIPFERQYYIPVSYKGQVVGDHRLDYLIVGTVVVELKGIDALALIHKAQVVSYLRATGLHVGLLINLLLPVI